MAMFLTEHRDHQFSTSDGGDGGLTRRVDDVGLTVPHHPLGIKPTGNAFTASRNIKSAAGLFSDIPDEIIIQVLELLHARSLLRLGATCKALYAFCHFDENWKALFIRYVFYFVFVVVRILIIQLHDYWIVTDFSC